MLTIFTYTAVISRLPASRVLSGAAILQCMAQPRVRQYDPGDNNTNVVRTFSADYKMVYAGVGTREHNRQNNTARGAKSTAAGKST